MAFSNSFWKFLTKIIPWLQTLLYISCAICFYIQSTLVNSKSKGPSAILRDIRTSTYQMCRIEENTYQTTKFHRWTCNLTPLVKEYMLKILWKKREIAPEEQFHPLSTIFYYLMLNNYVKTGIRFSLRDKRLFEITEVEITRVDCISYKRCLEALSLLVITIRFPLLPSNT